MTTSTGAWTCAVTVPSGGAFCGAGCALGRCASSASTPGGTRGDGAPGEVGHLGPVMGTK